MTKKTLLCVIPILNDSTSFYRAWGPLVPLARKLEIELWPTNKPTWAEISACDAVFMQRAWSEDSLKTLAIAKDFRKPVWMEWDDNLFDIRNCHEEFKNVCEIMKLLLSEADFISVSTKEIQKVYSEHTKKPVQVIPNAHNDYLYSLELRKLPAKQQNAIIWRGGESHLEDLMSVKDSILQFAQEFPDWKWIFFGYNPLFITNYLKNWAYTEWKELNEYMALLKHIAPKFGIVPLIDTSFNHAKSNCAYLEYSWAGISTIASELPEWRAPGVCQTKDFLKTLRNNATCDSAMIYRDTAWEHISDKLILSKVNLLREQLVKELLQIGG